MRHPISPSRSFALCLFGLLVVALSGCGAGDPEPTSTWHRDVQPILQARCVNCHNDGGIGPFDLTSYDKAKAIAGMIKSQVQSRKMPPWGADAIRDYRFNPRLSDDQIASIAAWADEGAPQGSASDTPVEVKKNVPKLSRTDVTLKMPTAFTPQKDPDDYRCFLLDWKEKKPVYVTGFAAKPGNTKVVHHIAAFLLNPGGLVTDQTFKEFAKLDADEKGPGYTCFGGPNGKLKSLIPVQQLAQWVPGARGTDFPEGTGILVKPGAKVVLQIHYNMREGPQPDQTAIEFKIDGNVKHPAAYAPWLNPVWPVNPETMKIAAGDATAKHTHKGDPRNFFKQFVGGVKMDNGFDIHSVLLHLHELGKRGVLRIKRKDGTVETLLDVPRYDFNWQRVYWLVKPVRLNAGDELDFACHWDNSESNQPKIDGKTKKSVDVFWGEGTAEEMCVANLYISQF